MFLVKSSAHEALVDYSARPPPFANRSACLQTSATYRLCDFRLLAILCRKQQFRFAQSRFPCRRLLLEPVVLTDLRQSYYFQQLQLPIQEQVD